MTRDDLFNINASIVKTLVEACAKAAPDVSIVRQSFLVACLLGDSSRVILAKLHSRHDWNMVAWGCHAAKAAGKPVCPHAG